MEWNGIQYNGWVKSSTIINQKGMEEGKNKRIAVPINILCYIAVVVVVVEIQLLLLS